MVLPAVKERILDDLEQLSPEEQERAGEMVHRLVTGPRGTPIEELESISGILDPESAREMREAIEEGCGQIDWDEWK